MLELKLTCVLNYLITKCGMVVSRHANCLLITVNLSTKSGGLAQLGERLNGIRKKGNFNIFRNSLI